MNQNTEQLRTDPIGRLLFKLSLPAMIGMLVTALYNIIDTIFVARGIGASAVAAIGIAFPIQMILMAVSSAVGLGGASISSRKLGKGDDAGAAVTFLNVLVLVGVFAAFAVSSAFFMLDEILTVFGATSAIMELSSQYLSVVLISSPFFMFTLAASAMVRAEGQAPYQMKVMLTTVVVNLVTTPLFIFTFDWGIYGAAWSTALAQVVGSVLMLRFFFAKKNRRTELDFQWRKFRLRFGELKEIMAIGSSSFIMMVSQSILFVGVNVMLGTYGGTEELAIFAIINKFMALVGMPIMGIVQGMQPIVGYNFGAKQFDRMRETIWTAMRAGIAIAVIIWLTLQLIPEQLMRMFTSDANLITGGVTAIHVLFAVSFLPSVQMLVNGIYQSLGKARVAMFLSLSRQTLYTIPLVFILPNFFGVFGVWLAFPIADAMTFLTAVGMAIWDRKLLFRPAEEEVEARATNL
ncbi:MATE family efflux transporter [Exiguobacterium sp. SL-9]|jgi:putative MATE family efflux protein|uniref:MATE family efflux transporter n=1 Tax=Exiguobacterium sp. SL-9 TaxID=2510963 RepID=UPI00103A5FF0|nr:MATE family efflux transporter [Exiguobacterium sp. SL-9]TCI22003.1 MATE family efflux transporter [Exiguobacterium sp. SL-9]